MGSPIFADSLQFIGPPNKLICAKSQILATPSALKFISTGTTKTRLRLIKWHVQRNKATAQTSPWYPPYLRGLTVIPTLPVRGCHSPPSLGRYTHKSLQSILSLWFFHNLLYEHCHLSPLNHKTDTPVSMSPFVQNCTLPNSAYSPRKFWLHNHRLLQIARLDFHWILEISSKYQKYVET